jgi:hypothetical protein
MLNVTGWLFSKSHGFLLTFQSVVGQIKGKKLVPTSPYVRWDLP